MRVRVFKDGPAMLSVTVAGGCHTIWGGVSCKRTGHNQHQIAGGHGTSCYRICKLKFGKCNMQMLHITDALLKTPSCTAAMLANFGLQLMPNRHW